MHVGQPPGPQPPPRSKETNVQRITITIDDDLLAGVDRLMQDRGYTSRSEAMRDILRDRLDLPARG